MPTPKHQIFFGPADLTQPGAADLVLPEIPPPDQEPIPPDDMTPPGWLWDSEVVQMSSASRTMDEGYTDEQLLYLFLNEL